MTPAEVLELPVVVDLPTANRALGIGDTLGYELAKAGGYPCPVLKVGRLLRVPRAGLLAVLGIPDTREAGATNAGHLALLVPAAAQRQESA